MNSVAASLFLLSWNSAISSPPTTEIEPPLPAGISAEPIWTLGNWVGKLAKNQGPSKSMAIEPLARPALVSTPPPLMPG